MSEGLVFTEEEVAELESNPIDLFKLTRYMYRIGYPIVADSYYDSLVNYLESKFPTLTYLKQTYDEDPVPVDLIKKYVGEDYLIEFGSSKYKGILEDEKSLSIRPLDNWNSIYYIMQSYRGKDLSASLKVDGVNQKSAYKKLKDKHQFLCSLSRGRRGDSREYVNLKKIVPLNIETGESQDILDIRGEVIVNKEGREKLKQHFSDGVGFVSAKSSALSLLTRDYPNEYYKYMKMYAFYCDALSDSVTGTFEELEKLGFDTPPHIKFSTDDMPSDFEEFRSWLMEIFDKLWYKAQELNIDSDGVVIEIDDLTEDFTVDGQYSDRAIACKVEYWSNKCYRSKVVGFLSEQQRVKCSLRAIVEPIVTEDGSTIRVINVYNPDVAIKANCMKGQNVYFERKSGTVSNLIYGERLDRLIREGVI